jgi:hypothetical protein
MQKITIEKLNYFSSLQNNQDYNSKVLYYKNNKLYIAHVFVDFFNRSIYESKQPKEGKVLSGLMSELNTWANERNFIF